MTRQPAASTSSQQPAAVSPVASRQPLTLLRQDGQTTRRGATVAREPPLGGRRVALLEHVGIVVGELLARRDLANRLDPDATVLDHGVAVRRTRVIDEACLVAVDRGVDDNLVALIIVDGKE